jgi:hypothetical protein
VLVDDAPSGALARLRRRLDAAAPAWTFLAVVGPLLVVYLATASHEPPVSPDPTAAARAASQLASQGTLALDVEPRPPWYLEVDGRVVTDRQPGLIGFAVPFYRLLPDRGEVPGGVDLLPAAIAGATAAALAMGVLHLALRRLAPPSTAVVAALVSGLATPTWSVSADTLWPHGPNQLWAALALLGLAAGRYAAAGGAFSLMIATRPNAAFVPLVAGIDAAWARRSPRPAFAVGVPSALGLAALVAYNRAVFGTWSVTGGYPRVFADNLVEMGWLTFAENLAGTVVSPYRGILVFSPFLLALAPGLVAAWRAAPAWARGAALAGLIYLVVHQRLNRFSGGNNFYAYRYAIESLTLAAPLLLLAWREWTAVTVRRRQAFWALATLSVGVHLLGVVAFELPWRERHPWRTCNPCEAAADAPWLAGAVVVATIAAWTVARYLAGRKSTATSSS